MSRDIRSFFSVASKKAPANESRKRSIPDDSDDDFVSETPEKNKPDKPQKKRKVAVISSDSEDEKPAKKASPSKANKAKKKNEQKSPAKVVSVADIFGSKPIQQSKVTKVPEKKKEVSKKDDFDKTLLDLDDDMFTDNLDLLDKTVDEATKEISHENDNTSVVEKKTPKRKHKEEEYSDLDSTIDPDQERYEKKRHSAALYQKYLNRGRPEHLGAKQLPKGKPTCLQGLCFLRTGVLDSLEEDNFQSLIKEHGGRTVHAVSKKVNYVVAGKDPGPAKTAKAESYGIPIISEDDLLDLILVKSGEKPRYVKSTNDENEDPTLDESAVDTNNKIKNEAQKNPTKEESKSEKAKITSGTSKETEKLKHEKGSRNDEKRKDDKQKTKNETTVKDERTKSKSKTSIKTEKITKDERKTATKDEKVKNKTPTKDEKKHNIEKPLIKIKEEKVTPKKKDKASTSSSSKSPLKMKIESDFKPKPKVEISSENKSWTEKYKPSSIQTIIGQQGPQSNMNKLINWLRNWHKYHSGKNRPKLVKPSPWAKDDNGAYFKAALLSGPPGVGKTTTATLVSKELGFDVVEFNASDTRSKKLLHEEVAQLLSTTSLAGYFKDGSAPTKKHVLLMDEVDGMAGNEDRGGIQELINLIKSSNVPIICMCNDRNHQKMRSLVNYCFDLRFARPRMEQIRGAMMSVCFKENIKITPQALGQIITSAGMDIRQVLNHLSVWTANDKNISEDAAKKEANNAKKDTVMGPWEVCRKVFSEEEHKTMSLGDKSRLFFYDYSLAPLFVQENYLQVVPHCPENEKLERIMKTADSLSMSDLVDAKIRKSNNWSLLEVQAMYASVLPGHYMEGHVGGQINFPGWLGKNSKRNKFQRMVCELQAHMRTSTSGSRESMNLDYIYHVRDKIIKPLEKDGTNGVDEAIATMNNYNLTRDDFDSLLELTQWPGQKDPMRLIESKTKAAFTRNYNKSVILPYAVAAAPIKKKTAASNDMDYGDEEEASEDEDADNITKDAMIKEKKKAPAKAAAKPKKEKEEASGSKKPRVKKAK